MTVFIAIAVAVVFILWKVPVWQIGKMKRKLEVEKYLNLENEYRKTIAQVMGGLFVLSGLAFTWLQLLATQKSVEITQDRLVIDQYAKAVDQLGSEKSQTRLGAIYTLNNIGQSYVSYNPVVDKVLASYIRQNFTYQDSMLREELQACLDVITRKGKDTSQCILSGEVISLPDVTLIKFDFIKSHFHKADLSGANLSKSTLIESYLTNVEGTDAIFKEANFSEAVIKEAAFSGSDFTKATLKHTVFINCNLKFAKFSGADLSGADLTGSDLADADLRGATLFGTNLRFTKGLTKEQLDGALKNKETQLPDL